jgi:osmotically-inducible protein OsmY
VIEHRFRNPPPNTPLMIPDPNQTADEVRAALRGDPRIKDPELIAVSVDEIGTVDLRGSVTSPRQRRAAVHDTRRVNGVFEVIDHLTVHPPIPDLHADDEIRAKALQRLSSDPRIHADHVDVKVSRGRVTLTGYVRHRSERAAAVDMVQSISGVVAVSDEIRVR